VVEEHVGWLDDVVVDAHQDQFVASHTQLVPSDDVTDSAPSDRDFALTARVPRDLAHHRRRQVVELRRGGQALAGSYLYEGDGLITGWHSHEVHQIEYALHGIVEVETDSAHYLLPPQQAAWIPVGLEHQAVMNPDVKTVAVMFDPTLIPDAGDRARIIAVSPLIREMMIYALRWPVDRDRGDAESDNFFRTLAALVAEALDHEAPLSLPTSDHPIVAAATAYTKSHLESVSVEQVSRAVAVSERTLRRLFQECLGLSWRTYLLNARMLRAMALLAAPGQSVQATSSAVGFDSLSAFTRSFAQFCGETPSAYRRRVNGPAN
jgi:AraC-like DNA-binding protein/quercetin dioxygenase-like cupin family protein